MVIIFDKSIDSNISEIKCDDMTGDIFKWELNSVSSYIIDTNNFILKIGAINTSITFNSLEALKIYTDAVDAYDQSYNPYIDGTNPDPYYDKIPSGKIVEQTYVDTNIEKDLIENN